MSQDKKDVFGAIAIVVGGLLAIGGMMFLAVTLLGKNVSQAIFIPPVVQILLGLLCSAGGLLFRRGHVAAKYILLIVASGVVVNVAWVAAMFLLAMLN